MSPFGFLILALLSASTGCSSTPSSCSEISKALGKNKVLLPGTTGYNNTNIAFWALQEASLQPSCIVTPSNAEDVAAAIKVLGRTGQAFAVKSGGHMDLAGAANSDSGVTINLMNINSTELSPDRNVAKIDSGSRWIDVYRTLDPLNLTVPGGRNGDVGVGGYTLAGGISYFGPRVGWGCDNVVNFEVVLSSGEIVNANKTSNPDLWRALKGGSNNFGVVTRFDFSTVKQGTIWGGSVIQPVSVIDKAIDAFAKIASTTDYDPYAAINTIVLFNSTMKQWTLLHQLVFTKEGVTNPSVFAEIMALPQVANTMMMYNLSALAGEGLSAGFSTVYNQIGWTLTVKATKESSSLLSQFFDMFNKTWYQFDIPGHITWNAAFETLPAEFTKWGALRGGNVLGVGPEVGNAIVIDAGATWPDTAGNEAVYATVDGLIQDMTDIAQDAGLLLDFVYLNYAGSNQRPIASYGEANMALLGQVSRRYDPGQMFQRQVSGGFKLHT